MNDLFDPQSEFEIKGSSDLPQGTTLIQIWRGEKTIFLQERGDVTIDNSGAFPIVNFYAGEKIGAETWLSLGGLIAKWLKKSALSQAFLEIPSASMTESAKKELIEGLLLGAFSFNKYKKKASTAKKTLFLPDSLNDLLSECQKVCDAVNMARGWGHEPAAEINPLTLVERAQLLAERWGLNCTVFDDQQLKEMGAGAIVAVGQGSKTPSRMIILEYKGDGKSTPVALVGKAITFDSGGYSIKPTDSMVGMKYDKCGAMAVFGVLRAAAALKLPTPLIGIICAAENMLSEKSYRPDDILISLSGKSIEVISTDAEGRLVLADGLTYAQNNFRPRAMVDLATLTGGCVVALGTVRAGVLCNNDALFQSLYEAGERTRERIWRLPHDEDYAKLIKGKDADIKNSGGRKASPVTGGMFLKEFVSDDLPWAHLDIAGVADLADGNDICSPGATGFGIRLLLDWLQTF